MDLDRAVQSAVARALASVRRKIGTVTGTSGTQVIVTVNGGSMTLPRLSTYTPTVGDVVHIDCTIPDAWLVLGKSA